MSLNPETLHGMHYSEEQFDAELERRLNQQIEEEGDDFDESDLLSWKRHFLRQLYEEWNPETDSDDFIQFETANSMKYSGYNTMGYAKEDNSNPLLEPIHGISLKDYTVITANLGNFDNQALFAAFGIDQAIFDELNVLWPKRMQEDTTFTVTTLFGQYYMDVNSHPVIVQLKSGAGGASQGNSENLEKMRTDKYFYLELEAARTAAYQYGLDGAKWIEDNFGISLIDFQSVSMEWMTQRNQNFNSDQILEDHDFQQVKEEEYKARFAQEQGGNVADDIEF